MNSIKNKIDKFSNLQNAISWCNRCIKLHVIMLGDDNKYWVSTFADAKKLQKLGYEIAQY